LRPVAAVRTGSNSAASTKTSVVVSPQPVLSPPMTPPRLSTSASSAMTVISASSAYSRPLSALMRSPARASRTTRSPAMRAVSKTWSGRLRSKVRKLVMSTSAEIGLRPIAVSRSCSQRGLGPLRTPRMVRPMKSGHAFWSSVARCTQVGLAKRPSTGAASGRISLPSPAAARSRAMPWTPRQSARFGVTLTSMIASSSPAILAKLSPTGASGASSMMPSWSSDTPIS
jgi:hypothetical protein